ncbi:MAG: hypothetical protein RIM99_16080 [Cyclobacteriaceae bacterium]
MNYKPDEATLTAYLYEELSKEEQIKVESYLEAHPEAKQELEDVRSVRKIMGKLEEKEVVTPSFVFEDSATVVVSRGGGSFNNFLRSTMAIAASITLLILTGYFTKMNIGWQESGFQISFDQNTVQPNVGEVSEENIKAWMQDALASNNEHIINKINQVEDETRQLRKNSGKNQLVNYKPDGDVIDEYVSQIKLENRDIILGLMEVATRDQKKYMDDMMADFALFLERQRQNDLNVIETAISQVANNVEDGPDTYRTSEE